MSNSYKYQDSNPVFRRVLFRIIGDISKLQSLSKYVVYRENEDGSYHGYAALKSSHRTRTLSQVAPGEYFITLDNQDDIITRIKEKGDYIEYGIKPRNRRHHPDRIHYMEKRYAIQLAALENKETP
jgi:hypothetical protein